MTEQLQRDPEDWKTGDEPMTEAQKSYLRTLADEVGEPVDESLTKAEASQRIDELRSRSPRVNTAGDERPAHPSPADGGSSDPAPQPPHPSQAEGERDDA